MKFFFIATWFAIILLSCSNKKTADEYIQAGKILYQNKDYAGAIQNYSKAIEIDSNNASALMLRGNSYDDLGDKNRALDDLNKAITKDPRNDLGYFNRGILYNSIKKYDLAINDFSKALNIYPNFPKCFYFRGICFYLKGNMEKAASDFEDAIRLDPNYVEAIKALSAIRSFHGEKYN